MGAPPAGTGSQCSGTRAGRRTESCRQGRRTASAAQRRTGKSGLDKDDGSSNYDAPGNIPSLRRSEWPRQAAAHVRDNLSLFPDFDAARQHHGHPRRNAHFPPTPLSGTAIDSAEPLFDVAENVAGDAADSAQPVMLNGYGNQCYDQAAAATAATAATAEVLYDQAAVTSDPAQPLYDIAETVDVAAADSAQPVVFDGAGDQCYDQATTTNAIDTAEPQYDVGATARAGSFTVEPQYNTRRKLVVQ